MKWCACADVYLQEGTGVWRAANLASRDACMDYCLQRQEQLAGSPYWHSEALSPDGKLLFIHYQNVLMNKASRTLTGVSSGILVHAFDEQQKITRCDSCPAAHSRCQMLSQQRFGPCMGSVLFFSAPALLTYLGMHPRWQLHLLVI